MGGKRSPDFIDKAVLNIQTGLILPIGLILTSNGYSKAIFAGEY
jgi:hypothetical protein